MRIAPHGSWVSPLDARALTDARVDLGHPAADEGLAFWSETRSDQGGRTSVWCSNGGAARELTPDDYVRDSVHEYGGGAWAVRGGVLVYSTFPSNQVWALDVATGERRPLTTDSALRYAAFDVHPECGLVLAVREDHRTSDLDCVNTIVALRLGGEPGEGTVVASGADFYGAPVLSEAGRLAWVEWDHPNMPWDSTRLMVGRLAGESVEGARQVAGSPTSAPCYPRWRGEEVVFLDDPSGFWNFYAADAAGAVTRLNADDADFCGPAWVLDPAFVPLADGRLACVRYSGGRGVPGLLRDGSFTPLAGAEHVGGAVVGGNAGRLVLLLRHADRPATLETWDAASGRLTPLVEPTVPPLPADYVSVPRSITWTGPQGEVQGFYYPPASPDFAAPAGSLPPLKVLSHGGPTGAASPWFSLAKQYWTTRGWAILDVNYGGSALFGRAYRERLRGNWGVVDVRDCADGVRALVASGLADAAQVAIEGGSAGGFTTLAALTSTDAFAAGRSLYGIGDLALLARETHKFESRYLFGLLGGSPDEVPEVYAERSPINHLDRLSCPMLIEQGADDRVVPPDQAVAMADAVRAKGLPVALVIYPGEGHGFRRAENIQASTEAAASFYGQVFGFDVPGVPVLTIENLRRSPSASAD